MKLGFLVFIGLPGSGKTTLANILKQNFNTINKSEYLFVHICYDNLIPFNYQKLEVEYKILRKSIAVKIENFVTAVKLRKKENCPEEFIDDFTEIMSTTDLSVVFIIDDNMYFKSMRYILYQIARKLNLGFCQIFIDCPIETALLKNSERNVSCMVPPHVIENMLSKLEPPNLKNNWEKFSVTVNAFCNVNEFFNKLFPLLYASLINLEIFNEKGDTEQKLLSSLETKKNIVHQCDIALRKIVSCKIKDFVAECSNYSLQQYSSDLKTLRLEILNDIRLKNISLPNDVLEEIELENKDKFKLMKFLNSYF